MRRRSLTFLVWTLACWQALLLMVCVPTASAHPVPSPVAHACCDQPTKQTTPDPADIACPHCSDGHGRFVDAGAIPFLLAPTTLIDRVTIEPVVEASITTLADERPIYRPPDPSLFALRCALIR